jgi:hypothetical protein
MANYQLSLPHNIVSPPALISDAPLDASPGTSDFSYSCWFTITDSEYSPGNGSSIFLARDDGYGTNDTISPVILPIVGTQNFQCGLDVWDVYYLLSAVLYYNRPYNLVITVKRSDLVALLYLNGILEDTVSFGVIDGGGPANLQWDALYVAGPSQYIGFAFDQFRFYKTVLTQVQVTAIFNNGLGVKVNETSFAADGGVYYAELDEGTNEPVARFYNGSWHNSALYNTGTWESGGVPFGILSTGFSYMDEISTEGWYW